ncbi:MAG: DUF4286 family protein [Phycisphaerales bacterium]
MHEVAYTVTALLPDAVTRDRYVRWLQEGHIQQVVAGGAKEAIVVVIEEPATPLKVVCRYIFASKEALDRYTSEHAPKLRAEGLRLFGPELGVSFERSVGKVIARN